MVNNQNQRIINLMVPVGLAALTFVLVALLSIILSDTLLLKIPLDDPEIVVFGYIFMLVIFVGLLVYAKRVLYYFEDRQKFFRRVLIIFAIPGFFGLCSGYNSYTARKKAQSIPLGEK